MPELVLDDGVEITTNEIPEGFDPSKVEGLEMPEPNQETALSEEEQVEELSEEELVEEPSEEDRLREKAIEDIARDIDWVPKDEYKGDKRKWVDAKTWIKRGHKMQTEAKKQKKSLERRLDQMQSMLEALNQSTSESHQSKLKDKLNDLYNDLDAAVEEGDRTLVREIIHDIDDLKEKVSSREREIKPSVNDNGVVDDWMEENSDWWQKDDDLTDIAASELARCEKKGLPIEEALERVNERLKNKIEVFRGEPGDEEEPMQESDRKLNGKQRQSAYSKIANVTSGSRSGDVGSGRRMTYADLSPEGQEACDYALSGGLYSKDSNGKTVTDINRRRQMYVDKIV